MSWFGSLVVGFGLFVTAATAAAQDEPPPADALPPAGAVPAEAEAGKERYPLPYTQRPITLPAMIARADLGFELLGLAGETAAAIYLGGGFGITGDLQVDATIVPLGLSPEVAYGDPDLTVSYRFLGAPNEDFQMGARLNASIPVNGELMLVNPSIFGAALVAEPVAIGFELGVPILIPFEAGDPAVGLALGLEAAFQIAEPFHVGATTGFGIADFSAAGDSIYVPLGFLTGFAIGGDEGPLLDIGASFDWPLFLTPAADSAVQADIFIVGVGASGYFYL